MNPSKEEIDSERLRRAIQRWENPSKWWTTEPEPPLSTHFLKESWKSFKIGFTYLRCALYYFLRRR
jgi:hypothetical protein